MFLVACLQYDWSGQFFPPTVEMLNGEDDDGVYRFMVAYFQYG